ncbi:MAG: hypothetical protein GY696_17615 [Gammaproteobacteria bacterium]|nr:hypothetical protein [Gammaproteobacteria bacterium]
MTPFLAYLGRVAKLPVDMVIRNHQQEYSNPGSAALDWMDRMSKIYTILKEQEGQSTRTSLASCQET